MVVVVKLNYSLNQPFSRTRVIANSPLVAAPRYRTIFGDPAAD